MQLLTQKSAMIGHAVGTKDIDTEATLQLLSAGRADAEHGWDPVDMCILGAATDLEACMRPVKQLA